VNYLRVSPRDVAIKMRHLPPCEQAILRHPEGDGIVNSP
jgi:hypothetical protein